jgi:hypothetical protein
VRGKNYSSGFIVSVEVDVVGFMAAYLPVVRVCTAQSRECLYSIDCTDSTDSLDHGEICCHNTEYVHVNGYDRTITVILAKHCIKLPDDGSLVIRNMLEQF